MVFAAIGKMEGHRFMNGDGAHSPIDSAWHYFETMYRSGIYWQFVGWGQFLTGMVLMTQRYATLGAVMLLPISANIFVITISYAFNGTPFITGLILLGNIFLLLWDLPRLLIAFGAAQPNEIYKAPVYLPYFSQPLWTGLGILIFLTTVGLVLSPIKNTMLIWLCACLAEGLIGLIISLRFTRSSKIKS